MKSNVDLTERGLFRRDRESAFENVLSFIKTEGKHPWNFYGFERIKSDTELYYNKPLIICGTHSDRQRAKDRDKYQSGRYCDRCGCDLDKKPWYRHYGLCSKCMDELELDINKYWRYKFDHIRESENFVTVMLNYIG